MIIDNLIEKNFFCDLRGILILEDAVPPKENSGFVLNSLKYDAT